MKILKFGGSSVATSDRIINVIEIVKNSKDVRAVVFSAFSGVTDKLIEISTLAANKKEEYLTQLNELEQRHVNCAKQLNCNPNNCVAQVVIKFRELENLLRGVYLLQECSSKTRDLIISYGEQLSCLIINDAMNLQTEYLDARTVIKTNENYSNAKVNYELTNQNITRYFNEHEKLQIVTGFIASTEKNTTTTLGRGGSDFTATILAAALNASEVEIWTDTNGFLSCDPRKVPEAFSLKQITYKEAMELAYFGAKVIYPPTLQPAIDKSISIKVKNTFNPTHEGTTINQNKTSNAIITGLSSISNISLLRIEGSGMIGVAGISKRLFSALAQKNISVILTTQASSEHTICIAVIETSAQLAKEAIEDEFKLEIHTRQINPVIIDNDLSIIAIVGEGMQNKIGVAGAFLQSLSKKQVNILAIAQGSSEINISVVIKKDDEIKALNAIHKNVFSNPRDVDVFIIGTGTIGSKLIEQINLNPKTRITIKAIANRKNMLLNNKISQNWQSELNESNTKSDIRVIIDAMKKNHGATIFVDCTASEEIVTYYEEILKSGISIVTPNKKANSMSYELYEKLNSIQTDYKVKFLSETTVGAGLPVLNTLNDLLQTGDEIIKIEAVLSGTLSYIFNNTESKTFSEVVIEAKEKGYTEPDVRDDLNGLDVARKILILARQTGLKINLTDIRVENLLPLKCQTITNQDELIKTLREFDADFETKKLNAQKNNAKLRYVATLENNKAYVSLKEITQNNPLYLLQGADNMISYTTKRYKTRPLVVSGPGAGADVTAAGVLADILRVTW